MNDELETIWTEAAVLRRKYYLGICLERLRKKQSALTMPRSKFNPDTSRIQVLPLHWKTWVMGVG
jgi:hypothetical protein